MMGKAAVSIIWEGPLDRAEALLAAISPDDPEDFKAELIEGKGYAQLRISVDGSGLGQSRSSVDDILACLSAAESGLDSID
tara:strand:- start:222 stop:464 length:243 start_codon:yes stop_codon:yes gene_type:complete